MLGSNYIVKLGYESLLGFDHSKTVWWWSKLWKVKAPLKVKLLMWLALNEKVLTWEMMRKRNREGDFLARIVKKTLRIYFCVCIF